MYRQNKIQKSSINANIAYQGEPIEQKIRRLMNNKEPIEGEAPLIYTERKDGIQASYDVRTDKWEIACEAKDKIAQQQLVERGQRIGERTYDTMSDEQKKEFHGKYPNSKIQPVTTGGESKA